MRAQHGLVFSEVFLPHPLQPEQVSEVLTRMAADRAGSVVILETRATKEGIRQLLGCAPEDVHLLRRLLSTTLPGTILTSPGDLERSSVQTAKKLRIQNHGLPLQASDPERFTRALYAALSRPLKADEAIVVQAVIGQGSAPQHVPAKILDPHARFPGGLLTGVPDASAEERGRVRDHFGEHQLDLEIRLGVASPEQSRRQRFGRELTAAYRTMESPGVSVRFVADNPNLLNAGTPPRWWRTQLSISELVPLSGWPIVSDTEASLPGMRPAHPKLIRAAKGVEQKQHVFAVSDVPGDHRLIGMTPRSWTYHGLIVSPTGGGKSTLLANLFLSYAKAGDSALLIDPKGQAHVPILRALPKDRWGDLVLLDPTDPQCPGFNPADATGRDPDVVADGILNVFRNSFDTWGPQVENHLSVVLRTLTRAGNVRGRPYTLIDIPRVWVDEAFRRQVVREGAADDAALQMAWRSFETLSPSQRASQLAAPMNRLNRILLRPAAVRLLGTPLPGFHLRNIFREHQLVVAVMNEAQVGPLTAELLSGLILSESYQAVQERAGDPELETHFGHVMLDEADRLISALGVPIEDAYARSRAFNVGWISCLQSWSQVPTSTQRGLSVNARLKIAFRLEDYEDARTFGKLAPELDAADFQNLERFQIWARPVVDGVASNWALAHTLPEPEPQHSFEEVRTASLARFHRSEPDEPSGLTDRSNPFASNGTDPSDGSAPSTSNPSGPVGRKRRGSP